MSKPARISHEGRIVLLAFLAGLPGSAIALYMLWTGGYRAQYELTFTTLIVCAWLGFAFAVRERVVFPLQTLSNLLGALREGDFSVRGRSPCPDDALGEVMREVNTLSSTLREQRLGAMEATTLLRTVMSEIDVAIFAFDEHHRLRLVNRAAERLMAALPEGLLGQTVQALNLETCLDGPEQTTMQASFPGGAGRLGRRRPGCRYLQRLARVLRNPRRTDPSRPRVSGVGSRGHRGFAKSGADFLAERGSPRQNPDPARRGGYRGRRGKGCRSGTLRRLREPSALPHAPGASQSQRGRHAV